MNRTDIASKDGVPKEEQARRPKDAVFVHVFRGDRSNVKSSGIDMSALVITSSGEVYGTGVNTLIGWVGKSPLRMKYRAPDVLEGYVKVDALSGLGLRKIVVGLGFGIALTHDGQMYMWGGGPHMLMDTNNVLNVDTYRNSRPPLSCHCMGMQCFGELKQEGGINLNYCPNTKSYKVNTFYFSLLRKRVKMLAEYNKRTENLGLECLSCGETCSSKAFKTHPHQKNSSSYDFVYCQTCDRYRVVEGFDVMHPRQIKPPRKVLAGVLDVDCSHSFICILSETNDITLWSWKDGVKIETVVKTPESARIMTVRCGTRHFVALCRSGNLYTRGGGDWKEDMYNSKDPLTLTKVNTSAPVKEVCCGNQLTLCLLANRSIWLFSDRANQQNTILPNTKTFSNMSSYQCLNKFFLKLDSDEVMVFECSLRGGGLENGEIDGLVKDVLARTHVPLDVQPKPSVDAVLMWMSSLYGKTELSDLTLKLSDGDFPAHRLVLFGSSAYFKSITVLGPTLDVTSYNSRAYKVLLQYFYRVEPDDLELNDLLQLCAIAIGYKEQFIIADVVAKLKRLIRVDNSVSILNKASSLGILPLMKECAHLIVSPDFERGFASGFVFDRSNVCQSESVRSPKPTSRYSPY